jgi:hypothetical protein
MKATGPVPVPVSVPQFVVKKILRKVIARLSFALIDEEEYRTCRFCLLCTGGERVGWDLGVAQCAPGRGESRVKGAPPDVQVQFSFLEATILFP